MIVNVVFVGMGSDDESVVAFGKAPRQLMPQTVRLLRRDLSGGKGLTQMVGDHVVRAALPSGLLKILLLEQQELRVRNLRVALVGGDEPPVFGFVGILDIADDIPDGGADAAPLADVQGNEARSRQMLCCLLNL